MEIEEHLYYMHDVLKNVAFVFDGEQKQRDYYEYAPFGGLFTALGDMAQANKFRFSCEYMDDELGLIYYNYRHFNPQDGKWINRDPLQESAGWNLYRTVKNLPTKSYDRLGCIGIFGALGGALIDYGFQVATNYIKGKEEPWTDIDWGSVTTSAALGAVGVPGALKTGTKIYKNIQGGLKMGKRIKAGQKIRMCDGKPKTPHGRKLHKRQQNKNEVYQMYKSGAQDNALLLVSIILLKRIGSEIYEETKKEIEQQNKGCCQDIIVIITIISVLRIEDFEEHNPYNPIQPIEPSTPGGDILETNPNYIPPIRPFYPLR